MYPNEKPERTPVLFTKTNCMKALEVRIGNYAEVEGVPALITAIHSDANDGRIEVLAASGKTVKINAADLKPISITTELLAGNCGFNDFGRFRIGVDDHIYQLEFSEGYISLLNREGEPVIHFMDIRNLHQLQNLYYALKGKEMEITDLIK